MKPAPKPFPANLSLQQQFQLLTQPETNPTGYVPLEHADAFPFDVAAAGPSRVNAWWLAEASWLSYWHDPGAVAAVFRERAGLSSAFIQAEGAECYIASSPRFAIAAFRGTQPDDWSDIFDDACFVARPWDAGHVHEGFARRIQNLKPELDRVLGALPAGCRVWFTGHSLGAAAATLAAYRYRHLAGGVCTFGSPLVGNGVFAGTFGGQFAERSTRYQNDHDLVTQVPPGPFALPHGLFTHVDHLRWINKDGQIGTSAPPLPSVLDIFGSAKVVLDLLDLHHSGRGRSLPDGLADHTPLYYVLHCWNDFALHG